MHECARAAAQRVELARDACGRSETLDGALRGADRLDAATRVGRGRLEQMCAHLGEDPAAPAATQLARELGDVIGDRVQSCACGAIGAKTASTALRKACQLATRSLTAAAPLCESA